MKAYRIIHAAANIIAFGLLGAFLLYFLLSYGGLPERIGVHFSAVDGQLDVYSYKVFGFYPFAAGFTLLGIFSLLTLAVKKLKKSGLDITEKGSIVMRSASVLLLDLMKLIWSAFFSYWTYCVVHQTGMGDGTPLGIFRVFFIIVLLSSPILFSEIRERYRTAPREDRTVPKLSKKSRYMHIAANVISFGILGVFLVWFIISYESLPERIGVHFASDGSFDVYSYKVFGFYPLAAGFGLLAIFCLLSFALGKIKRTGLRVDEDGEVKIRGLISENIDGLKLIWSAFFSAWSYSVIHQTPLNTTFITILMTFFLALLPMTIVMIMIIVRQHRPEAANDKKETDNDNLTGN